MSRNIYGSKDLLNFLAVSLLCRGELRRRFWSVRCVNVWNGLPEEVVEASSLGWFKRLSDVHMGHQFYDTVDGQ